MNFDRLHQWWRTEKQKITVLSPKERPAYIWDYYKLWIIGILSAVLILSWGIHQYVTTNPENWFFACFANTNADIGDGSAFWEDYADYAGYDLNEKNLIFNAKCYCDPIGKTAGNVYYQMLITYLDGGVLDALVMETDRLQVIGASGRLMDLENEQMQDVFGQYGDRLIYCEPLDQEYGKESVPIGIDLSDSILVGNTQAYIGDIALGVNALAPHPEQIKIFLEYLFDNNGGYNDE